MRRFLSALLIAAAGMLVLVAFAPAQTGQPPKGGGDPPPVSISFRNETKLTLVVQGSSEVKGMKRRGQPVIIRDGKTGFDNNVPPGRRWITVFDYNQPTRPLLVDLPIAVPAGRDLKIVVRTAPNDPNRVILKPEQ